MTTDRDESDRPGSRADAAGSTASSPPCCWNRENRNFLVCSRTSIPEENQRARRTSPKTNGSPGSRVVEAVEEKGRNSVDRRVRGEDRVAGGVPTGHTNPDDSRPEEIVCHRVVVVVVVGDLVQKMILESSSRRWVWP